MIKRILLTSGGTAGHIWPIVAVYQALKKQNPALKFLFIGTKEGVEATLVPDADIPFQGIIAGKLHRYFSWTKLLDPFKNIIGFFQALWVIKKFAPDKIFAKGGYVTLPVGLAAWILRKKIILHESDAVLGLTNKILAPLAEKICVSFPKENYPKKYYQKMIYTGVPVREEILDGQRSKGILDFDFGSYLPIILVTGGSQGAHHLNNIVSRALPEILSFAQVVHLSGKLDFEWLKNRRQRLPYRLGSRYRVLDFLFGGMGNAIAAADLVISRAGATIIAELAALKKSAILVPLPSAAAHHQEKNAEVLRLAHAAVIIYQEDLTPKILIEKVKDLLERKVVLEGLAEKIAQFYQKDSAQKIVQEILEDESTANG